MKKFLIITAFFIRISAFQAQEKQPADTLSNNSETCELKTPLSLKFTDLEKPSNIYHKSVSDFTRIFSSPLRWNKEQYIKAGFLMAAGFGIYALDEQFYTFIDLNRNPYTEFGTKYILEPLGNYTTFTLLAGMAGYGLIFKSERPTTTAILAAESYLITGLFTLIPKNLVGRVRPHLTDPLDHNNFKGFMGGRSFWSGHTATVFGVAAVIADMYKDKKIIPIIAYTTATLTGLSRIHDAKHWPSDVFFGAVIGTAIGKMIVRSYKSKALSFSPSLSPYSQGFQLTYHF